MDTSTNELSGGETTKAEPIGSSGDEPSMANTSTEITKMEVESAPEPTTITSNTTDHSSIKRKNSVDEDGRVSPVPKQMALEPTDTSTLLNGTSVESNIEDTTNAIETAQVQEEPEPVEEPITTETYPRLLAQTVEELRKQVCLRKLTSLSRARSQCIANLTEQYFLEQNMNYLEYDKWRQSISRPNPFLQNFIEKNYENQGTIFHLEQAIIKKFGLTGPLIEQSSLRGILSSSTNKQVTPTANSTTGASQLSKLDPGGGLGPGGEKPSIADRARHEAHVLKRIAELRKSGLWSLKRLPKLVEPGRPKTHWDYLLDEMSWMATDFQQERKWKINCCKKLALAVHKHFREKQIRAEQAEKEESRRAQRQAQLVAREVTQFWRSIEKIVKYKQDTLLEEKRKATMNLRLNMIVDQTEKYSSWLMESLNQAASAAADKAKSDNSTIQNMSEDDDDHSESDESESIDNESTIEAEELMTSHAVNNELDDLRMESELPLEDLLKSYKIDQNYFDKREEEDEKGDKSSDDEDDSNDEDDEEVSSGDMSEEDDDEETIEEEERQLRKQQGQNSGYQNELDELNADNSLSIEELMAKLAASSGRANEKIDETASTSINGAEKEAKSDETSKTIEGSSNVGEVEKEQQQQALLNTIADKAQSFQPTGYTLETTQVKTPVPTALLKHPLREYQHVGLDWLVTMHDNKLNGILADEMGLGKTIQTIALLAHLACEKGNWGPHLIVVPTSVMLNWELEFKKWAPGFKILTYYGSPKERKFKRQGWTKSNAFHVCITSYKLVVQDHAVFRRKKWKYFILDEAQNIKNFKSQRWQALLNFQSQRRLLLTGTPLQNNLMELWSLMHFLMPHVFSSHREFQLWFNNPLKSMVEGNQEYNEQIVKRLHKVLRPFILRRLKKDVEKQMPKKYEHIMRCKLSKRQRLLYDEFMSLASTRETLAEGRYMSVINILMQLRKVCNHPDLFDPRPTLSPFVAEPIDYQVPSCVYNLADEALNERVRSLLAYQPAMPDMELMYSAFACHRAKRLQTPRRLIEEILTTDLSLPPDDSLDELKPTIDIDSFFINSTLIGLEICENPAFRHKLKQYLAKSQISVDLKSLKAEHFRSLVQYLIRLNKQKCSFVKPVYGTDLHHCIGPSQIMQRANLHTIGSTAASVYGAQSHTTCVNTLNYEANKHKSHIYWSQTQALSDLINWTRRNFCDPKFNRDMLDVLSRFVVYVPHVWFATKRCTDPYESEPIKLRIPHPCPSYYAKQRTLIEDITDQVQYVSTKDQLSLTSSQEYLRMNNTVGSSMLTQFPEKRLIQYDCGKLQLLATLLRQLHSETHRVLVFTQMTRMLDILENFLNYHGYKYLRLDGSTGIDKRQMLMERFNNDKRIFAFILSTRSGGIGVNLTGADTVIFYDSDWNPTMDAQAQDRCHRIGQTRDVHIYRLISERTVEENILRKASQKRLLSDMTIEGGCFTTAFLTKHHITELFEEGGDGAIAPANADVTPMAIDSPPPPVVETTTKENVSQLEEALAMVEDETDVKAAKELREEVRADIDEFDENQVDVAENGEDKARKFDERLEIEFKSIETELRPVERYALKFMESFGEVSLDATQEQTDVEMEQVKKDWELTRLKQLKEEEERKAELEEDEMLYSYSKSEVGGNYNNNTNRRGGGGGENNASKKLNSTNSKKLVPNHSHMLRKKSIRLAAGGSTSTINHHHAHQKSLQLKKSKVLLNVKKKSAVATTSRHATSASTTTTTTSSRFTASLLDSEVQRFNKKNSQDQVFGKKNLLNKPSNNSPHTNPSSRSNITNSSSTLATHDLTTSYLAEKENKRQLARKKPRSLSPSQDNKSSCDTTLVNEDGSPVSKETKKAKKPRVISKKLAKLMDSASFLNDQSLNKSNDLKLHHNTLNSSSDYSDDEQRKSTGLIQQGDGVAASAVDGAEVVKKKKKKVKELDPNKPKMKRGRKPKYLNPDGTSVASTNKNSISQLLESSNLQRLQLTNNNKVKKPKSNKTSPETSMNVANVSSTVASATTVSPPQTIFNPMSILFTQTQQPHQLNEKPKILHLTPVLRNPMPSNMSTNQVANPTVIKTIVKQVHSNVGNMMSTIPASNIKSNLNIPNISLPTQNRPPVVTIRNLGMPNPAMSSQPKQILITKPLSATGLPSISAIATPVATTTAAATTSFQILAPTASPTFSTSTVTTNPPKLVYKTNTSPSKKPLTISAITAAQQAAAAAAASSSGSLITQTSLPAPVVTTTTAAPILMLNPVGHVSLVKPSISDTGLILNPNVTTTRPPPTMQLVQNAPGMMMSNLEEQSKLIKQYLGQNFGEK